MGGAYIWREICVLKSAGLIIGRKLVSAIFPCANDNIGALLEIRDNFISLNMPTSNTTATNFIENGIPYQWYRVVHCKDSR